MLKALYNLNCVESAIKPQSTNQSTLHSALGFFNIRIIILRHCAIQEYFMLNFEYKILKLNVLLNVDGIILHL